MLVLFKYIIIFQGPPPPPPPGLPIDQSVILLIFAGLLLGIKKSINSHKNR